MSSLILSSEGMKYFNKLSFVGGFFAFNKIKKYRIQILIFYFLEGNKPIKGKKISKLI